MTRISAIIFFLVSLITNTSFAQHQADWWYFGEYAGLHFTNGGPVAVTDGALNTSEGCSAISDASGNLLFYTDGITVYTKQHTVMPNSGDLMGDISSSQSALIVPQPGSATLFYIFTTDAEGGPNGFRYSIVDLSLNGGLGDVTQKNILVKDFSTEKVSAVGNYTGMAYWVLMHEWGSDAFYAYQLTAAGFNSTPVISHVGTVHSMSQMENVHGYLKFSPDGTRVAVGIGYQGIFEVFDFDNATGTLSNPITIFDGNQCYGVEFSPDNSKLYVNYVNTFNDTYNLDQFDLSSNNPLTIIGSRTNIFSSDEELRGLQLGPDKKVYAAIGFINTLAVINNPNAAGIACDLQPHGIDLAGKTCELGLPGFPQSVFGLIPIAAFSASDTIICTDSCINFTDLSSNIPQSWEWTFPGSDTAVSHLQNPSGICFHTPGSYTVQLIAGNASGRDTATLVITVKNCRLPMANFTVLQDSICRGDCIGFIDSSLNADSYLWNFGGGSPNNSTEQNPSQICFDAGGNYVITLTVSNVNGSDSAQLLIHVDDCGLTIPNAFSPNGDGKNDIFYILGNSVASIDLKIFNRWGQEIFETTSLDKSMGWNGYYKGVAQPIGVYVYVLNATMGDGSTVFKKGNLTLLR